MLPREVDAAWVYEYFSGVVPQGEQGISNAMMFSAKPGHILFRQAIEYIVARIRNKEYGNNVLDITGPVALTRALAKPLFIERDSSIKRSVILTTNGGTYAGREYYRSFVRFSAQELPIAVLDTDLHGHSAYADMWTDNQVFCDEEGDPCVKPPVDDPQIWFE